MGHVFKIIVRQENSGVMKKVRLKMVLTIICALCFVIVNAQDGNAGIQDANQKVRSYFNSGTQLMYAVGAIVGLIGAIKVYQKWNAGDHDTGKVAAAWFGSCVFLVVVVTVIRAFFGI
jgi:hypothetical protein